MRPDKELRQDHKKRNVITRMAEQLERCEIIVGCNCKTLSWRRVLWLNCLLNRSSADNFRLFSLRE